MHKNKYNKLCKTNEKITIEWKMIDEKTIKTYIGFNETIRKKWMKGRNMMKRGLAAFLTGIMTVTLMVEKEIVILLFLQFFINPQNFTHTPRLCKTSF